MTKNRSDPSAELRAKLRAELLPSEWKTLATHHRRGAVFLVDRGVELLEVALAVAEDRGAQVQAWIEAGWIARPTLEQVSSWEREEGAQFISVIVQPFVLAQRLDDFVASGSTPDPSTQHRSAVRHDPEAGCLRRRVGPDRAECGVLPTDPESVRAFDPGSA